MTNSNKPKKDEPKTVALTVINTADFKDKKRAGITLREYKELSAKDHLTLTPSEQKSLAEAQQQFRKMTESLTNQYDFSALAKLAQAYTIPPIAQQTIFKALAINTTPMLKIATDMQKLSLLVAQPALAEMLDMQKTIVPAIQAICQSTVFAQNQFTALAAIQKSLALTMPMENIFASIKGIQDVFQAPIIARTMFADFHNMHERILRSLQFDVGSLTSSVKFSHFETVDITLDDIATNDDNLTATATATQTNTVAGITFTNTAGIQLILSKLDDNKREIAELRQQLLTNNNQQGQMLIAPSAVSFKRSTSSIQIGPFKVSVTVSSNYTRLARFLLSTPESIAAKWDIEDLAREVFSAIFANDRDEEQWKRKIKGYANHFNQQVMIASGGKMPKFIDSDGVEYFVNPEYLNL